MSRDPYTALRELGHSAAKAAEIVLDATRGDSFSQQWIELAMGRPDDDPRGRANEA